MKNTIALFNQFENEWHVFKSPVMVLETFSIEEVIPLLEKIEDYVSDGFFAAGFLSYEAAPAFDSAFVVKETKDFPLCWFGIYKSFSTFNPMVYKKQEYKISAWEPSITGEIYNQRIRKIKSYIKDGYSYQVNYTYRLHAALTGDPFSFFLDLLVNQETENAIYIDTGDFAICSVSPELFFRLDGREIVARPMKGTLPRGRFLEEDRVRIKRLANSEKDRAENIMIVDMVRNDLGRIALTDTIKVKSLYDVERYRTALQMTSTVSAQTEATISQILSALFPCASITGAPKVQTMKIIAEMETSARRIYTGSAGFVMPGRKAQFNVLIRTVLVEHKNSYAEYGVGGGIMWESDPQAEFDESQTKAKVLTESNRQFSLLESILWTREEGYFLLDYHLKRMGESAVFFDFPFESEKIIQALQRMTRKFGNHPYKVRILLEADGKIKVEYSIIDNSENTPPLRLAFAAYRVDSANPMLFHKTTYRKIYQEARHSQAEGDDVILINENGEITETCVYNILLRIGEDYITPAAKCGLLPGSYRAWLLDNGLAREEIVKPRDLKSCDDIFVINSVRKSQKAIII